MLARAGEPGRLESMTDAERIAQYRAHVVDAREIIGDIQSGGWGSSHGNSPTMVVTAEIRAQEPKYAGQLEELATAWEALFILKS